MSCMITEGRLSICLVREGMQMRLREMWEIMAKVRVSDALA